MIKITVKEAAELKGCSEQFLRKQALNGEIKTLTELTKNGRKRYMIPLTELSEAEQLQYYRKHDIELPKELTKPKAKKSERSTNIEDYTESQREEMVLWHGILQEWNEYCIGKSSKVQATKEFVELMKEKYPDIKISTDILYRRKRAEREYGICGQVDKRGGHNKGSSVIPELVWQSFLYYYLDQSKKPVTKCIEETEWWISDNYPELLPLPSETTFYRHIKTDIAESLKILGREGEKAFDDRCAPYIRRLYDQMESNDWWVADTHTFDIISSSGQSQHRLYLVAFMDVRSGIFTGWHITDKPSSQATLIALRKGILKYGIPKNIYVDNGREFLTHDVGGLGHRQHKKTKDNFVAPPVFERLGIKMTNAIVRNAKAKIIERRFVDIKNGLSRLFDTFTGGTVVERPERLKQVVKGKQGVIPTDTELIKAVNDLIEYYFNYEKYGGAVVKDRGKLKIDVYNENLKTKRVAGEKDLNLMLMRSSRKYKVGRRGVHLDISGERIDYWNDQFLNNYLGQEVYFRYDPDDLSSVRIYDLEDRYIMTVPADNEAVLKYGTGQEEVKSAIRKTKSYATEVKRDLKDIKKLYGRKTALEITLEKAHQNKDIQIVQSNPVINIHRANEQEAEVYDKAVGADDEVSFERMIRNIEKHLENED